MVYSTADIVKDVRRILDEQGADDSWMTNDGNSGSSGATESDDSELDEIITGYIVEARNFVVGGCDIGLLDKDCQSSQVALTNGVGTVNNMLRLIRVTSADWKRDVTEFLDMGSADYTMFSDPITQGTIWSPKVAVGLSTSGTTAVVTRIAATPGNAVRAYYAAEQRSIGTGADVNGEPLKSAVRNYIAALVCLSLGDEKRSDDFMHVALSDMGVAAAGVGGGAR